MGKRADKAAKVRKAEAKRKNVLEQAKKDLWAFMDAIEYDSYGGYIGVPNGPALYVGIDPGAEGAVSVLYKNRYHVFDIPVYKEKRGKKNVTVFDNEAIHSLMKVITNTVFFHSQYPRQPRAMVEQIQPNSQRGSAYAQFRIGCAYAMWPLYLMGMGFNVREAHSAVWKRKMGLIGDEKEWVRRKARKIFPDAPLHRKKDHNRAEALLIGEYCRSIYKGE